MLSTDFDVILLHLTHINSGYQSSGVTYAKELSKKHRVFLIDRPLSLKDLWQLRKQPEWRDKIAASRMPHGQVKEVEIDGFRFYSFTPPYTFPFNVVKSASLYDSLSQINHQRFNAALQHMIDSYHIQRYIIINSFNPFLLVPFPKLTPAPLAKIYRCIDEISEEPYIARHGVRLENLAVTNYDFTIATSTPIWRRLSQLSNKVHLIPNGADTDMFKSARQPLPPPADLPTNGKSNITYVGNLSQLRIDYQLIKSAALACPQFNFIIIGPYEKSDYQQFKFEENDNVYFLGPRKMGSLPAYLKYTHCAIIPYLKNKITASIYPLKMNEYLAAGCPVVCTNFSEELQHFKEVIHIADNTEEFIQSIQKAVTESTDEWVQKRQAKAEENKWSNRVSQIYDLIAKYCPQA